MRYRLIIVTLMLMVVAACNSKHTDQATVDRVDHAIRFAYKLPPDVRIVVSPPVPSTQWAGYDDLHVTVSDGDQKQDLAFLLSRDGKVMYRMVRYDLSSDPLAAVRTKIDTRGRPMRGSKTAKVTLVVYDDLQCPFCARFHQTLADVLPQYNDRVAVIYKDFPLRIHSWATHAAIDANCLAAANDAAYWAYVDYVHLNLQTFGKLPGDPERVALLDRIALEQATVANVDTVKLERCLKSQDATVVDGSLKEGQELGIRATPTTFINGLELDGAVSTTSLRDALEQALHDANPKSSKVAGQ